MPTRDDDLPSGWRTKTNPLVWFAVAVGLLVVIAVGISVNNAAESRQARKRLGEIDAERDRFEREVLDRQRKLDVEDPEPSRATAATLPGEPNLSADQMEARYDQWRRRRDTDPITARLKDRLYELNEERKEILGRHPELDRGK